MDRLKRRCYKQIDEMNFDTFKALGTYLLDMRAIEGLSLRALSGKIGVTAPTLGAAERGTAPSLIILAGYCRYTPAEPREIDRILKGQSPVYKCPPLTLYDGLDGLNQAVIDGVKAGIYANAVEGKLIEFAKRYGGPGSPDLPR